MMDGHSSPGRAGFIGAHLSRRLLDDGRAVTLVDNLSRGVEDAAWRLCANGRFRTARRRSAA